jgi:hypothetical protein
MNFERERAVRWSARVVRKTTAGHRRAAHLFLPQNWNASSLSSGQRSHDSGNEEVLGPSLLERAIGRLRMMALP